MSFSAHDALLFEQAELIYINIQQVESMHFFARHVDKNVDLLRYLCTAQHTGIQRLNV